MISPPFAAIIAPAAGGGKGGMQKTPEVGDGGRQGKGKSEMAAEK